VDIPSGVVTPPTDTLALVNEEDDSKATIAKKTTIKHQLVTTIHYTPAVTPAKAGAEGSATLKLSKTWPYAYDYENEQSLTGYLQPSTPKRFNLKKWLVCRAARHSTLISNPIHHSRLSTLNPEAATRRLVCRAVHQIISMIKWIRTSRLLLKNSLSLPTQARLSSCSARCRCSPPALSTEPSPPPTSTPPTRESRVYCSHSLAHSLPPPLFYERGNPVPRYTMMTTRSYLGATDALSHDMKPAEWNAGGFGGAAIAAGLSKAYPTPLPLCPELQLPQVAPTCSSRSKGS